MCVETKANALHRNWLFCLVVFSLSLYLENFSFDFNSFIRYWIAVSKTKKLIKHSVQHSAHTKISSCNYTAIDSAKLYLLFELRKAHTPTYAHTHAIVLIKCDVMGFSIYGKLFICCTSCVYVCEASDICWIFVCVRKTNLFEVFYFYGNNLSL